MHTRQIQTDGLTQTILEAGEGPLVLFIHGFPDLGLCWRAQVRALADAGYHAVAPDMRGYGGGEKPGEVEAYSILSLVGDMVDLVRALGATSCVVVGHDWGAPVAWHCALIRPDLFRAVFALSVPFQPRRVQGPPTEGMAVLAKRAGRGEFYINRFQAPDAHEALDADPATTLRKMFYAYDGATPADRQSTGFMPEGVSLLESIADDATLPPWMSEKGFGEYVDALSRGGFKSPLDWYRNVDRNWLLTAPWQDAKVTVPAAFVVGERDPVRHYAGPAEAALKDWAPDLRMQVVVPGAGHWIQQERPDEVNRLLLEFLGGVLGAGQDETTMPVVIPHLEAKFEIQSASGADPLTLTIYQPVSTPSGSFEVVYELSGAMSSRISVFGETEVQALGLAMKVIAADLSGISRRFQLRELDSGRALTAELFGLN
ncbi:MAG: alpha/beta hydrolase [Brevundimonas sp.]|nr:MAG: alpha/beta hydrolase [Brevundimonas sp.]